MGVELLESWHQSKQGHYLYLQDSGLHHRTLSVNHQLRVKMSPVKQQKLLILLNLHPGIQSSEIFHVMIWKVYLKYCGCLEEYGNCDLSCELN